MYICTHVDIYIYISIYIVIVQWIYIYIRIHGYVSTYNSVRVYQEVSCLRIYFLIIIGAWESRVVEIAVHNLRSSYLGRIGSL